ncbi:MAG: S8 family serine peptidase, partial [Bacteroidota bacterium]
MREDITYIGIESPHPQTESRVLDLNLNPNGINRIHHAYPQWQGQKLRISVQERAYDQEDIDLRNRSLPSPLAAAESDQHATEMATIIAGAGNSFVTGRGIAPRSKLISSDFALVLPDPDTAFANRKIWVQNHSYGTSIENFYGVQAEAFDQSANRLPRLLHVFSSGNEGEGIPEEGLYQGMASTANLTGNFKMAKNILTVGATDTTGNVLPFSSRGPAYDGRIKPELVAYSVFGSSNAAALVSGTSLLLQEAYREAFDQYPPSSLLKAALINSADDVGVPGPDFQSGYGSLNAWGAMQSIVEKRFVTDSIGANDIKTFMLMPVPNARNIHITLVWNDPAAEAGASQALVNDLDLSAQLNGDNWYPWRLSSDPDSLLQAARRGPDHLNNVEQILIDGELNAPINIEVSATQLTGSQQSFAIVWEYEIEDHFQWHFPTGSDNMPYNG